MIPSRSLRLLAGVSNYHCFQCSVHLWLESGPSKEALIMPFLRCAGRHYHGVTDRGRVATRLLSFLPLRPRHTSLEILVVVFPVEFCPDLVRSLVHRPSWLLARDP